MQEVMLFFMLLALLSATTAFHSVVVHRLQQSRSTNKNLKNTQQSVFQPAPTSFGSSVVNQRSKPLRDLFGLGPTEIAISVLVAFVLFGPETLKSLSKDVGRAAAELKEIPKTFKEGMEEGVESSQVSKMKQIAAEKRKKRDEKLANAGAEDEDDSATDA